MLQSMAKKIIFVYYRKCLEMWWTDFKVVTLPPVSSVCGFVWSLLEQGRPRMVF